ncbi:retrovirus-related pol polyprotein from transposon TNT 1-94 [Tanacetum coccineum]
MHVINGLRNSSVAGRCSKTTTERYVIYSTVDAYRCYVKWEAIEKVENQIATVFQKQRKSNVTSSAPTYDPEPATVTEDEEMSKEKEIDKLMALISLSGTGYDNQRAVNVAGARENVGTPVVQKSGIQCYNCKEYGHVSREFECRQAVLMDDTDDELMISWWYPKYTPPGYNWKPKSQKGNVNPNVSMPLGNASRTANILEHKTPRCSTVSNTPSSSNSFAAQIYGTVQFGNDQIAPILGYGDLVQGTITIKRVYYVEGLNHNLFSVGQFCDADLEVAFRKSTCYIRD